MQTPSYLKLSQEFNGTKQYELNVRELKNLIGMSVSEDKVLVRLHNQTEELPNELEAYLLIEEYLKSISQKLNEVLPQPKPQPKEATKPRKKKAK